MRTRLRARVHAAARGGCVIGTGARSRPCVLALLAVLPATLVLGWDLPYDLGATAAERANIRASIDAGQTVSTTFGNPLYPCGAGLQGWQ